MQLPKDRNKYSKPFQTLARKHNIYYKIKSKGQFRLVRLSNFSWLLSHMSGQSCFSEKIEVFRNVATQAAQIQPQSFIKWIRHDRSLAWLCRGIANLKTSTNKLFMDCIFYTFSFPIKRYKEKQQCTQLIQLTFRENGSAVYCLFVMPVKLAAGELTCTTHRKK